MYVWDPSISRYRDDSGKVVPISVVRDIIANVVDAGKVELSDLALQYTNGTITAEQWRTQAAAMIKYYHEIVAAIARGGTDQLTDSDNAQVQGKISSELDYLDKFVAEVEAKVAAGNAPSRQGLINRSQMYGDSAWATGMSMERKVASERGYDLERRILFNGTGDEHSCKECLELARRGWQPIFSLPEIGSVQCLNSCRCSWSFARTKKLPM